jgi:hypothetical protein
MEVTLHNKLKIKTLMRGAKVLCVPTVACGIFRSVQIYYKEKTGRVLLSFRRIFAMRGLE